MQFNHDLSLFKAAVKKQARNYKKDLFSESEDVEQDCWVKILEMLPVLNKMPAAEARRYAAKSLHNHVADIVNASAARNKINVKLRPDSGASPFSDEDVPSSVEDMMDRAMCQLDRYVPIHQLSQEQIVSYRKLVDDLLAWSNNKSERTRQLVKEMVDPSEATLKRWAEMEKSYPVYKAFHSIPPSSFADIFGCSKVTIFRIMEEVRFYLESIGYGRTYLAQMN